MTTISSKVDGSRQPPRRAPTHIGDARDQRTVGCHERSAAGPSRWGMRAQLRRYRIVTSQAAQFARGWRDTVAPLRERHGFRVKGWLVEDSDEFVWLLEHEDRASFEAAEAGYYASAERQAVHPDPARLIAGARKDWVTTIRSTVAMPMAHRVAGLLAVPAIVIYRQEVRPMYAVSGVGAPLQCTIARLR